MYTFKFGGKNAQAQQLEESNDRIVVRTKNARSLNNAVFSDAGKKTLENFSAEVEFPESDVTILKTKPAFKGDARGLRDASRTVLKTEEELRFAGRVLVDPSSQSPVLYTENLFIKFYDTVKTEECERILAENNLVIKQRPEYAANVFFVSAPVDTGLKIFDIANAMLEKKEVELCHPELIRKKSSKTIHPLQWHLQKTTVNGAAVNANVNADKAQLINKGEGITIAVIDDGVDINNPEFNIPGKVVSARDVTQNSNDPRPKFKGEKHGTACAGVAAAHAVAASGVAPNAKLMPIRLSSQLGSIEEANAFKWAVDHGADIISCSWGPEDGDWSDPADPLHNLQVALPDSTRLAFEYAVTKGRGGKGCVITYAAGNGNEDTRFDGYASSDKVIAVAACNDTNKRSVYSDFGDAVWCSFPSSDWGFAPFNHPDALTNGIYTTDRMGAEGYNKIGDYTDDFGGTSSACPGVAGVAALVLSANPDLTWQQVKQVIKDTCEKIDVAGGQYASNNHSKFYGYGKVDAEKAVKKALSMKVVAQLAVVRIVAAMVDPNGVDIGHEKISLRNTSTATVNLSGWAIEIKGKRELLTATLAGGETKSIELSGTKAKLSNTGATINLLDASAHVVHTVSYKKVQVKKGLPIQF